MPTPTTIIWKRVDKPLVWLSVVLLGVGLFVFISAALSLFAKDQATFTDTLIRHLGLGFGGGLLFSIIALSINIDVFRRLSFWICLGTVILTLMVFTPLGFSHGGAVRWLAFGSFSFQPAEFLKIGIILFWSFWLTKHRGMIHTVKYGLVPFIALVVLLGGVLLTQPDTDSFLVIVLSCGVLYFIGGASWRHIAVMATVAVLSATILIMTRPYVAARFKTFIDPTFDPQGSSYQVRQSLLAVGSGEFFGRGYGQGVQKFYYLPEPMSDAIFAVVGEEFGFVGTTTIVFLYLAWCVQAFRVALRVEFAYPRFVIIGVASWVVIQTFVNILSNLGLFPYSGLPLPFMSQGGTALLVCVVGTVIIIRMSNTRGYSERLSSEPTLPEYKNTHKKIKHATRHPKR